MLELREQIGNALVGAVNNPSVKVLYGYWDGREELLPIVIFRAFDISRVRDTESFSTAMQVMVNVYSSDITELESITNSILTLDGENLGNEKIFKFLMKTVNDSDEGNINFQGKTILFDLEIEV